MPSLPCNKTYYIFTYLFFYFLSIFLGLNYMPCNKTYYIIRLFDEIKIYIYIKLKKMKRNVQLTNFYKCRQ